MGTSDTPGRESAAPCPSAADKAARQLQDVTPGQTPAGSSSHFDPGSNGAGDGDGNGSSGGNTGKDDEVPWAGFGILAVIIGGVILSIPDSRAFLIQWWPYLLAAFGLIGSAIMLVFLWRSRNPLVRATVVIFGVVAVLLLIIAMAFLPENMRPFAVGSVWLAVASLLPLAMYYLFIATRRKSLLNEFISNLNRLGLISGRGDNKRAISAYLEKFEAVYGRLRTDKDALIDEIRNLNKTAVSADDAPVSLLRGLSSSFVVGERSNVVINLPPNPAQAQAVDLGEDDATSSFASLFSPSTGIPLALATALITLGWLMVLSLSEAAKHASGAPAVDATATKFAEFLPTPKDPGAFAFLGAYFFSIQMLFRRYVRRDLGPSAYVAVTQRIILALIAAWVLSYAIEYVWQGTASTLGLQCVVAFTVGVFPLVVWQFIQALFRKMGSIVLPHLEAALPLSSLDGLTVWHEARLEEEDIESVPNMATADIVELLLNTQIPPDRLVDWIDQAILLTAVGPDLVTTRRRGREVEAVNAAIKAAPPPPPAATAPAAPAAQTAPTATAAPAAALATTTEPTAADDGETEQFSLVALLRANGLRTATALLVAYGSCRSKADLEAFEAGFPAEQRRRLRTLVDTLWVNPHLCKVSSWRSLQPQTLGPAFHRDGSAIPDKLRLPSRYLDFKLAVAAEAPSAGARTIGGLELDDSLHADAPTGLQSRDPDNGSDGPPALASGGKPSHGSRPKRGH